MVCAEKVRKFSLQSARSHGFQFARYFCRGFFGVSVCKFFLLRIFRTLQFARRYFYRGFQFARRYFYRKFFRVSVYTFLLLRIFRTLQFARRYFYREFQFARRYFCRGFSGVPVCTFFLLPIVRALRFARRYFHRGFQFARCYSYIVRDNSGLVIGKGNLVFVLFPMVLFCGPFFWSCFSVPWHLVVVNSFLFVLDTNGRMQSVVVAPPLVPSCTWSCFSVPWYRFPTSVNYPLT